MEKLENGGMGKLENEETESSHFPISSSSSISHLPISPFTHLLDLSHPISSALPVFPEDRPVELHRNKELAKDGYTNFLLCNEMHVGTHVDGPMHLTPDQHYISEIPLDRFAGEGILFDVQGMDCITLNAIDPDKIKQNQIVLFHSGMDTSFGEQGYFFHHPVLDEPLARFLVSRRVKAIGIDWYSPDKEPYPIHRILLENRILILENLTNLSALQGKDFDLFAFPLKIQADSSPVRAVASPRRWL